MTRPVPPYKRKAKELEKALATVCEADIAELYALRADIAYRLAHKKVELDVIETAWLEKVTRP